MIPDWKIELVLKYKHKFPINMWRKDIINEAAKHYTRNGSLENIISSLNNTYFKILKGKINVDRFNEPKGRTDLEVKKV